MENIQILKIMNVISKIRFIYLIHGLKLIMAGIDKALVAITIAIMAIALGATALMGTAQDAGPTVSTPPTVSTETSEPKSSESFGADLAAKVREEAGMPMEETTKPMKSGWDRLTSVVDPGMGHESHQLAIILAPSSILRYTHVRCI